MSLGEIMRKRLQNGVSPKEKYVRSAFAMETLLTITRIAVALQMAVAVLQLHGTPWIGSDYGQDSVFFHTNVSTPDIPLFEPAYVSRTFITANATSASLPVISEGRKLARNPLLYGLGVSLMELTYGQRLLALALPDELDSDGNAIPTTEMLVAARLLGDIQKREHDRFALAAASCVQCDLGYPFNYSLDDDKFRANFIERVITPLKEDYDAIAPGR